MNSSFLSGHKLYQKRARQALPILVRQAKAEQPIYYSALAEELDMPNPRNLNYVLGFIGEALQKLSKKWDTDIPPIQSLVVNKYTGIPGEGFWGFAGLKSFAKTSLKQKRLLVQQMLQKIFQFNEWDEVLKEFELKPVKTQWTKISKEIFRAGYGGGGESEEHKKLKEFVAKHPQVLDLPRSLGKGQIEYEFPSADAVDVLFIHGQKWIGVEVKAKNSPIEDIARGIYQCIKYRALIEAKQMVDQKKPNADVRLVLEGKFPKDLFGLKNTLGIEVIDSIVVR
jgi:hypothetical protein